MTKLIFKIQAHRSEKGINDLNRIILIDFELQPFRQQRLTLMQIDVIETE